MFDVVDETGNQLQRQLSSELKVVDYFVGPSKSQMSVHGVRNTFERRLRIYSDTEAVDKIAYIFPLC